MPSICVSSWYSQALVVAGLDVSVATVQGLQFIFGGYRKQAVVYSSYIHVGDTGREKVTYRPYISRDNTDM